MRSEVHKKYNMEITVQRSQSTIPDQDKVLAAHEKQVYSKRKVNKDKCLMLLSHLQEKCLDEAFNMWQDSPISHNNFINARSFPEATIELS